MLPNPRWDGPDRGLKKSARAARRRSSEERRSYARDSRCSSSVERRDPGFYSEARGEYATAGNRRNDRVIHRHKEEESPGPARAARRNRADRNRGGAL